MEQKRSFSLFGPLLLIAAGVIWLLVKAGTIPSGNLWTLTHIWPILLIAGRRHDAKTILEVRSHGIGCARHRRFGIGNCLCS